MENWERFLDDCEKLLKTDITKPDDLLAILNFVNNGIQFLMELSDSKLPIFYILITKFGKKKLDEHLFKASRFKTLRFLPF